jgi:Uma2 family endonuclease
MNAVLVRRWNREEYNRIVEGGIFAPGERVELIDGEILAMTPQGSLHATALLLIEEALRLAFGTRGHVRIQLPLAIDPSSEPEPDITVVSGSPRDYRDAHPRSALLIVEISDTTLLYDREQKGSLYARAGLTDYWIVNLLDRILEVHREPVPMPQSRYGWGYHSIRNCRAGDSVSPLAATEARIAVSDFLP